MKYLTLEATLARETISERELKEMKALLEAVEAMLEEQDGPGDDFLGWLDWPTTMHREEIEKIKTTAEKLREESEVFLVIGIGGSYLGSRAAIEWLTPPFTPKTKGNPEIIYAGHHLDSDYLSGLMDYLKDKEVTVNVISKSGTTTEPAISFRMVKALMEEKYGQEGAKDRIVVTTDAAKGALKTLADGEGYQTFVIPDDIGGRYSVLTPVGLLPIAVAGIDVENLIQGARDAQSRYSELVITENPCYQYAAYRNALARKGKTTEIMVSYDPSYHYMAEWWKQLFGESEGKDGKGIFPASLQLTTDLHSMGQYVQEGLRNLFETVVSTEKPVKDILVPDTGSDDDGLGYLAGKPLSLVNEKAMQGTSMAHTAGGVPVLQISIPEKSPYWAGQLFYFFMKSCAISGYLLGVNPFNQPGVEAYKANMFALLGKPGYEKLKKELESRWQE